MKLTTFDQGNSERRSDSALKFQQFSIELSKNLKSLFYSAQENNVKLSKFEISDKAENLKASKAFA